MDKKVETKLNNDKLKLNNFIKVKQTVIENGGCTRYSSCTSKGGSCC